jgi:hypothetical protein
MSRLPVTPFIFSMAAEKFLNGPKSALRMSAAVFYRPFRRTRFAFRLRSGHALSGLSICMTPESQTCGTVSPERIIS